MDRRVLLGTLAAGTAPASRGTASAEAPLKVGLIGCGWYGGVDALRSTAAVQLAMIALETGGRVEWDGAAREVRGNPEAAALLKRDYRGPWVHPWQG